MEVDWSLLGPPGQSAFPAGLMAQEGSMTLGLRAVADLCPGCWIEHLMVTDILGITSAIILLPPPYTWLTGPCIHCICYNPQYPVLPLQRGVFHATMDQLIYRILCYFTRFL